MKNENGPDAAKTRRPRMLSMVMLVDGKQYVIDAGRAQSRSVWNRHDDADDYDDCLGFVDIENVFACIGRSGRFVTIGCSKCKKTIYSGPEGGVELSAISCPDCMDG